VNFNSHSKLPVTHAFLSPSNNSWINYDDDKLARVFRQQTVAQRGTELHALGHDLIRLRVGLPDIPKTLNMYVNDAIGFRMTPEVLLYYSDNCYGHADAVGFRDNTLRIHDLKTGVTEAPFIQLLIYAALFCLEYKFDPRLISIELRIYQNDDVKVVTPDPLDIIALMEKIKYFSKLIDSLRLEDS
jgi:hypothetical protein